jgi:hypothetical protein
LPLLDLRFGKVIAQHRNEIAKAGCIVEDIPKEAELCRRTATAVAEGKVVGWFQAGWNGVHGLSETGRSWATRDDPT